MNFFRLLSIIFAITIFANQSFAAFPERDKNENGKPATAYTIKIPGKPAGNGYSTLDKIIDIPILPEEEYLPGAIYVKTKAPAKSDEMPTTAAISSALAIAGEYSTTAPFADYARVSVDRDERGLSRIFKVRYSEEIDPYVLCADLVASGDVEYAAPVFRHHTSDFVPDDPRYGEQWALDTLEASKAWSFAKGSKDIIIAIVDTGVDWEHPDLSANIWMNPNEEINGIDDDQNGFIDDIRGWDFVGPVSANQAMNGQYAPDNNPINKAQTHGTHVAGCAAAITDNATGVASPAFNCSIMAIKCCTDQNIQGIYEGYKGILYAARNGAHVINCSWGGSTYDPVGEDVIAEAVELGSVVVAASGNGDRYGRGFNIDFGGQYPAAYNGVLSVGATRTNNRVASFSNFGRVVTVFAPGQGILSTYPNNNYRSQQGTSMASPIVAGLAGLILSDRPDWSVKQVIHQIRSTSDDELASNPSQRPIYYGQINAYKALLFNGEHSSQTIPGMEVSNVLMQGTANVGSLTNYDPTPTQFEFTNYLGEAENLTVTLEPLSYFVELDKSSFNLGTMGTLESIVKDVEITLTADCPWFRGNANILATFESGDYVDYQLIRIPVNIGTRNTFSSRYAFPESSAPFWHQSHTPEKSYFFAVGQGGFFGNASGLLYFAGGGLGTSQVASDAACVYAKAPNDVFVGSGSSNPSIYRSSNYQNWARVGVSSITSFVNDIYFFDDDNGCFAGDPTGGSWGVGITTDGGSTWSPADCPPPLSEEKGWVHSTFWKGNSGWFGSNEGRVFRSYDQGEEWKVSQIPSATDVQQIGFRDEFNGAAVYVESDDYGVDKWIASTTNSGTSWIPRVFNLTEANLDPANFFSFDGSNVLYLLCKGGQVLSTTDNGASWDPVLTLELSEYDCGAAVAVGDFEARLCHAGEVMAYLDFLFEPDDAVKQLISLDGDVLDFGDVEIDDRESEKINFKNEGNFPIFIDNVTVVPDAGTLQEEFEIFGVPFDQIDPEDEQSIRINFKPTSLGSKSAVLEISGSADNSPTGIILLGTGIDEVSVYESDSDLGFSIAPNPSSEFLRIFSEKAAGETVIVTVCNVAGAIFISDKFENFSGEAELSTAGLPIGSYFLIIESGGVEQKTMLIVK